MSEFDGAVFKILAANDTGAAVGHQGGFVVPKDLGEFFPPIEGETSASRPTADVHIRAELFVDGVPVGETATRYQYQTWGGGRPPERRVTGNISALRNAASKDDLLLIRRSNLDENRYRFQLFTKGSQGYAELISLTDGRRWGRLKGRAGPIGNTDISDAQTALSHLEDRDFQPFDHGRRIMDSSVKRAARDKVFRRRLLDLYGGKCAISGISIWHPSGTSGLDGAHIVPVEMGGTDDPRNGLLLAKDVHWAFDQGLVGISADFRVLIGKNVATMTSNEFICNLQDRVIQKASIPRLSAHQDALRWHRENILLRGN